MNQSDEQKVLAGKKYRHYKGMEYLVHGVVVHSETLEKLVYYECLYENELSRFWVRPLEMFIGTVEIDGVTQERFRLIE